MVFRALLSQSKAPFCYHVANSKSPGKVPTETMKKVHESKFGWRKGWRWQDTLLPCPHQEPKWVCAQDIEESLCLQAMAPEAKPVRMGSA